VLNEVGDEATCLFDVERGSRADAVVLEGLVPALDFAVGLWVVGRGFDVGETCNANELFEVLCNELRAVVGTEGPGGPEIACRRQPEGSPKGDGAGRRRQQMIRGFCPGNFLRARWMMISISASVMDSRSS